MAEFKAHFKSVQPDLGGSLPGQLIFGIPGKDGGYYLVAAEQFDANTIRFTFTPSQKEMPAVDPIDVDLPGATDEQIRKIIEEYLQNNPAIGQPGKDGFSPIAKVTQTDDGAVVTITDKDGTTEAVIFNGRNGYTPQKGIDYDDGKSAYAYAKDGGYTGTEADFAAKLAEEYPDVPEWAMKESKPSYSKSEVGLGDVDNVRQYSASNPPPYPVASVNDKTGKVQLGAADVGARPSSWMPTAQEVGALPDTYVPPNQTAAQVGADPAGTAAAAVSAHNTSTDSHGDLRLELKAINDRLTAFFDSDNQTLDELSEIVAYITSNKALIDSITTSKVSVADIINNLTTNVANKPLSAAQGVALKGLIDAVSNSLSNYQPKGDYALRSELPTVPTKVSQLQNDKGYLTEHQDISGKLDADKLPEAINTALAQAKDSGEFDGDPGAPGKDGTSVTVKSVSESTADCGSNVVTFSDGNTLNVKNGKTGTPGKTPVYGVDYGTPAQIEEIVQQVITALGTPVFGRVDAENNIILSGALTDGFYTVKYEEADGNRIDIGSIGLPSGPSYTNLLTTAVGYDGNVLNGVGYADGYRLTGDAGVSGQLSYQSAQSGYFMTGYMPITMAQIENGCSIYVKGVSLTAEDGNVRALVAPDYDYTGYLNNVKIMNSGIAGLTVTTLADNYYRFDLSYDFLRNGNYPHAATPAFTDVKYFKLSLAGSGDGVIITLNQPIE